MPTEGDVQGIAINVFDALTANQATVSSNAMVCPVPCRAHGTAAIPT